MRAAAVLLLSMIVACDRSSGPGPDAPRPPEPKVAMPAEAPSLAKGSNAFAFDLWAKGAPTGNAAISPASITAALAMTYGGAKGDTLGAMKKTMHFDGDPDAVATQWGTLSRALQNPSRPLVLRIANRLFGEKSYAFEAPYLEKVKSAYGAPVEQVDFKTAFEPARVHINGWVEERTEHRIKDLLPPKSLDTLTRLVLVNAIYFLADWDTPFEKTATYDEPFTIAGGAKKNVKTMHLMRGYGYTAADGAAILEMPYKGGDAAMIFVLPDKVDGLAALEASMTAAKLDAWRAAMKTESVTVSIPRFEVNAPQAIPLSRPLKELGMDVAFDKDRADFTAIANPPDPRQRLHIDEVFHKAFVKVDEKGTEAAAATAVVMAAGAGAPPKSILFTADHPFLFFIVDKPSGLVLFMGRVADPS
jgi:serpin B